MDNPIIIALLAVAGVLLVVILVALWKLFTKMGLPGVLALIPGYNLYLMYKKGWTTKAFWAVVACTVVSALLHVPMILTKMQITFTSMWLKDKTTMDPGPTFRTILIMFGAAFALITLMCILGLCVETAMKFGEKPVYGLGLFFLPFVFWPILAFKQNKYVFKEAEAVYVALEDLPKDDDPNEKTMRA